MARRSATTPLTEAEARARLNEAHVYLETSERLAASDANAEREASGSNAVLAGIAAADAICGIVLGERSSSDEHSQAVALLKRATRPATKPANSLRRLLVAKTPVQYGVQPISLADAADLVRWASDVVAEADTRAS